MFAMYRLRVLTPPFDIWVPLTITREIFPILEKLGAEIYSDIEVIIFKTKEDMLVFRLRYGWCG